jgi:hypothetical protein
MTMCPFVTGCTREICCDAVTLACAEAGVSCGATQVCWVPQSSITAAVSSMLFCFKGRDGIMVDVAKGQMSISTAEV